MANQEHLDILKQGVEVWNQWRLEHPDIRPDFSGADLSGADLSGADLSGADLSFTKLGSTHLSNAHLNGAYLTNADLTATHLDGADISGAYLSFSHFGGADLSGANLKGTQLNISRFIDCDLNGADLTNADLGGTVFFSAELNGTDLSYATIEQTVFGDVDLRRVKGLDIAYNYGPSIIGPRTLERSEGDVPEAFLRGAGLSDTFIEYARSLVGKAIEYYSCFISYSSKDEAFAKRLYADLQNNNVRCWFAPEDLKWGERIRTGIDEAIRLHDKLLLILSKHSVASGWVEHEVKTALARERKEKRTVLFPVRVDRAVFDSPLSWATEIRHERNIGDFTRWRKNHDDYQKAFKRLLRDLKSETKNSNE